MSSDPIPTNGAWTGRDPRLRLLRTITILVLLGLVAAVVIDGVLTGTVDVATLGLLIGAILVSLGFEAEVRWPGGPTT